MVKQEVMVDSHDGSKGQQPVPNNNGSHDHHSASENNHDRPWAIASSGNNGVDRAAYVVATIRWIGVATFKESHRVNNNK